MTPDTKRALEAFERIVNVFGGHDPQGFDEPYPGFINDVFDARQALTAPAVEKIEGLEEVISDWSILPGDVSEKDTLATVAKLWRPIDQILRAYSRIQNQENLTPKERK